MSTSRLSVLAAALLSLFDVSSVWAGSLKLQVTCHDSEDRLVEARYEPSRPFFAEAVEVRGGAYAIYINPTLYYLGNDTQQWLYLRQCAHINENTVGVSARRLTIGDEEEADCWAVKELKKQSQVSSRTLYAIERDMERVVREKRWKEVLPGPPRRISLLSCLRP